MALRYAAAMRCLVSLVLTLTCFAGCSSGASSSGTTVPERPTRAHGSEPVAQASDRELDAHATFADLVRTARSLASGPRAARDDGPAGCLLRRSASGTELLAGIMPALDPTPEPPPALDRLAREAGPFAVLTAWGAAGDDTQTPATLIAAFTTTAPESLHARRALFALTASGAYVRDGQSESELLDAQPLEAALEAITSAPSGPPEILYLTADAALALSELLAVLERLPPELPVALAVLLPEGTQLPAPQPAPSDGELSCPAGLSEPAEDAAFGDLDPAQLGAFRAELHDVAQRCLEAAGARAPLSALRATLAIRIGEQGTPTDACVLRSEPPALDPELARCLVQAARTLPQVPLLAQGLVDLHVPLALSAERPRPITAGCATESTARVQER